ncbi:MULTISPECIES: GntR family transcriptional regulator [Burkholderia]|uniref:GntR family transcriptional regulator n=1 Tax=Burkholderia diffusa TaxID=488732 RepID=A0A6P2H2R4_9BURK|nr:MULTISPECIES: GntR family transcriptional regulator [Burkholderia]AOI96929.1 GntR family transcriptional regulator [Burkholderia sp. LA-2-3-30-S1-D2]KAB0645692.1 GntR family transcriptional regulator [Burkholderia diffusa]KVE18677.1 GntR family transcriptional regulator [Burkholderia sp. LA-2-3-30-S1-D2]MBM2651121.1 GntR family transcriptional regulator [Burkholderia diffusa]MCA8205050.1 GntR family transcriptional regulator [Burkholderia sp. AU33545]
METGWSELAPDPLDDTPLYLQLARNLASAIHAGAWRAGEALPSERLLSGTVGVSRITARRALALLVEQGLIKRARGAGSFITPRVADPLSRLVGFTAKMRQRGFVPDSVWLSRTLRTASRDEITRLGLAPGATVARLERLRRADGIVMAVEHSTLPAAVVPDPQALGASLYEYLDARGMTVVRALQHFRAANATHEIAKWMSVKPGSALLVITRIGYGADQRAIEVSETYCRDDYYDFVAELKR